MIRASMRTSVKRVSEGERSSYIHIDSSAAEQIKQAKENSGKSWAAWVHLAVKRLQKEDAVEIESLVTHAQLIAGSNREKARLSFRTKNADFDTARVLALKYSVDIQSVLIAALHLYSLASSMTLPDEQTNNQ